MRTIRASPTSYGFNRGSGEAGGVTVMVLPDLLANGLEVVFCGTAVGASSARQGAYYAGPGNAFWPTLHAAGFTPVQFQPSDYKRLLELGIGLTDLVKHVSGNDEALSKDHFDRERLTASIHTFRPKILAFTSKRAAQEFVGHRVGYGCLPETVGGTMLFVLPSPSGAARKYWSIEPWRELSARARLLTSDTRVLVD